MKSAYEWGVEHSSCEEALTQRKELGPDKTQADWWIACNRGDWLIWQLQRLSNDDLKSVMPALLRAVNKIADRAVRNYALKCSIREVEQWAEKWLSGEDRSATAADAAAYAARAAAYAASAAAWVARAARAANAAWAVAYAAYVVADSAADAAADAAWAAAYAARAAARAAAYAERKQQADDIRSEIPEWLWS